MLILKPSQPLNSIVFVSLQTLTLSHLINYIFYECVLQGLDIGAQRQMLWLSARFMTMITYSKHASVAEPCIPGVMDSSYHHIIAGLIVTSALSFCNQHAFIISLIILIIYVYPSTVFENCKPYNLHFCTVVVFAFFVVIVVLIEHCHMGHLSIKLNYSKTLMICCMW